MCVDAGPQLSGPIPRNERSGKPIVPSKKHLRHALNESVAHDHEQRPHQGLGHKLIEPANDEPSNGNRIAVDERLGGLLSSDRRSA
jgi:hypothetical protein